MSEHDPGQIVARLVDELLPREWRAVPAAPGVDAPWQDDDGAVLSVFAPVSTPVEELLAADAAALLATPTFEPDDPMRDGACLRGRLSAAAPTGPALLDATVVADAGGARRVVLQRPLP